MSFTSVAVLGIAALFATFAGFNDAGVLVGIGSGIRGLRPFAALMLLTAAVIGTPLIVGTAVAATLDGRLVPSGSDDGPARAQMLCGIVAAVAVTVSLAARRLPTSLTLALIGGIAGAGLGGRMAGADAGSADWAVVGRVLCLAAAAPLAGAALAVAVGRLLAVVPPAVHGRAGRDGAGRRLQWLHMGGFGAICLAYGANDGQKMLAVYAALLGGEPDRYARSPLAAGLIAGCFLLGGAVGLRRLGPLGGGLAVARQDGVVLTELSSAGVVLGTAAVGAPVSMTQSMSGALVGTGLRRGTRRVRWARVVGLGWAWMLTLPMAFLAGGVGAVIVVSVAF
ncbi:MAG: inorganic phosphate transporter [Hamadaea sp.]|uniref:inorganic phosphate transporter n=1 Tax=Hamadaea sp. TaxID=2024425 RepID=UPI0017D5BA95|nr:inorganic phosphate transporter [Hamadaea sp.]NUR47920.1 inorganic phosphate transporter [Hamadaea sp.]NUT18930.1 inorganic phosphate transporter [Hamadaea sp.]